MEMILFLDNSLIKKEYTIILIYLIFAIILTVLIIGASYLTAKQNLNRKNCPLMSVGLNLTRIRHVLTLGFA
jgi:hypothetical protein